jgi:SAM-dependent methyltransferase
MFIKQFSKLYNNLTLWGKLLILISFFMLVILIFKGLKNNYKEGFVQKEQFLFKTGADIYDNFYADIYDYLVFNNIKNEYELGEIVNKTTPTNQSRILDIGCGTGHHVASLASKGINILGIDISPSMIQKAKENYPNYNFKVADALNIEQFTSNSFSHIMCMYFTIYYIENRNKFFQNCMKWLMPGGYLIIHLVDREKIDPILPPDRPFEVNGKNNDTLIKFNNFAYNADFQLDRQNNIVKFVEKFKNYNDGKIRKNEHIMHMPDTKVIVDEALNSGFILYSQIDLLPCNYQYQYIYIFTKPN